MEKFARNVLSETVISKNDFLKTAIYVFSFVWSTLLIFVSLMFLFKLVILVN